MVEWTFQIGRRLEEEEFESGKEERTGVKRTMCDSRVAMIWAGEEERRNAEVSFSREIALTRQPATPVLRPAMMSREHNV